MKKESFLERWGRYPFFWFAIIIAINLSVFYPSFSHIARGGDHIYFLIETVQYDDFFGLIQNTYSYVRTRSLAVGDGLLFRPLLYSLLSVEKYVFGYNFVWWQVVGFLLHIIVLWQIFKILLLYISRPFSFLLTLFFSVLCISNEMVVWHHLSSYLMFLVFFLEGFYQFLKFILSDLKNSKPLWICVFYLTVASLFYELGIVLSGLMGFAIFVNGFINIKIDKRRSFLFSMALLLPIVIFFVLSCLDLVVQGLSVGKEPISGVYLGGSDGFVMFGRSLIHVLTLGIGGLLFPSLVDIRLGERSYLQDFQWMKLVENLTFLNVLNILGVLILVSVIFYFLFFREHKNRIDVDQKQFSLWATGFISFAFIVLFSLAIIFGRLATKPDYLRYSLYDFYIFYVFLLLGGSFLMRFLIDRKPLKNIKVFKQLLGLGLILFVMVNSVKTYEFNLALKEKYRPFKLYLEEIRQFVSSHKQEDDFSFAIYSSQYQSLCKIYTDNAYQISNEVFMVDAFYENYVDNENPKYWLVYSGGKGLSIFFDKMKSQKYSESLKERKVLKIYTNEIR